MNNEQFWQAVLGNLELSLSKPNFTTWFKNTYVLNNNSEELIIGVPNAFTKEWLKNKYHQNILQAVRAINPDIRQIRYKILPPSAAKNSLHKPNPAPATPPLKTTVNTTVPERKNGQLNPRYNFSTFIVGKTNELAHAAAVAVAEKLGVSYNPLFIYGGVGLGKTHLMQAVGNQVLQRSAAKKVLYVSSERFTNDFIQAVKEGRADDFKHQYRTVDVLLIDDIQLLAGKEQTQEEFFHTFNALYNHNKQIVITADRLPKEIPSIEERLVSRFEGGMVADIQPPDFETRMAILKSKAREKNYNLKEEILEMIASRVQSNIRELEGALNRLVVYCQINNSSPSPEKTKEILNSFVIQPKKRGLSAKKIMETVASYYNVTPEDLIKQSRKKEFVKPRQIAMYLIRQELETSLPSIGEFFGGRDHTTVIHALEKVNQMLKENESLKQELNFILDRASV